MDHKTKMLEQIEEGIFDSIPNEQIEGFAAALVDIGLLNWDAHTKILQKYEERQHNLARSAVVKAPPSNGTVEHSRESLHSPIILRDNNSGAAR